MNIWHTDNVVKDALKKASQEYEGAKSTYGSAYKSEITKYYQVRYQTILEIARAAGIVYRDKSRRTKEVLVVKEKRNYYMTYDRKEFYEIVPIEYNDCESIEYYDCELEDK